MSEEKETMPEDIKKLMEENLKLTKEILKLSKKNNKMLNWQRAWGFLRVLLIIIPIILGAIYLPPLLDKAIDFSEKLFGLSDNVKNINPSNINLKDITPDILKQIKH